MPDVVPGSAWTEDEVRTTVSSYFRMLENELTGSPYVKASERRFVAEHTGRSGGAVEFKFANVSAVLRDLRLLYVEGYRPRSNYQTALRTEVEKAIDERGDLTELMARQVMRHEPTYSLDKIWPIREDLVPVVELDPESWSRRRSGRHVDFVQLEAANRALGLAGELAVVRQEKDALIEAGRPDLSDAVDHVSVTVGDGLGYDIQSFDAAGREKLIEVKTTRRDAQWPFYVTRNELELSKAEPEAFQLYRVHGLTVDGGKFYVLPGSLQHTCTLDPTAYSATPRVVA